MGIRLSGCRNVPIERPASNQRTAAGFDRRFRRPSRPRCPRLTLRNRRSGIRPSPTAVA